jgi:Tfp pilus assembly protein PilP
MRAVGTFVALVFAAASLAAQAGKPASPAPAVGAQAAVPVPGQAAPTPPPAPAAPESYTYDPDGRRDPFLNLLGTGSESKPASRKGEGPSGIAVADISVRGVMQSQGGLVAMIQGPDSKTYIIHQGDKLLDGTVKTITPQGLIIMQEVNDPLSLVKQREVRKLLRGLEDVK